MGYFYTQKHHLTKWKRTSPLLWTFHSQLSQCVQVIVTPPRIQLLERNRLKILWQWCHRTTQDINFHPLFSTPSPLFVLFFTLCCCKRSASFTHSVTFPLLPIDLVTHNSEKFLQKGNNIHCGEEDSGGNWKRVYINLGRDEMSQIGLGRSYFKLWANK